MIRAPMMNLILLIIGFTVGQGAVFLTQTWLIANRQAGYLGLVGGHLTMAVLAAGIVDLGSLTTLTRRVAIDRGEEIEAAFWSLSIARALVSIVVVGGSTASVFLWDEPFSKGFAVALGPGLLVWALNAAAILDGVGKSGLSGLSNSLPYVLSSIAMVVAMPLDDWAAGLVLGAGFSLGLVLSSAFTHVAASFLGIRLPIVLRRSLVRRAMLDGGGVLLNWLPGQQLYRFQIIFAAVVLGSASAGLFVYAKQVINTLGQLLIFVRRVQFPDLVKGMQGRGRISMRDEIRFTWPSLALGTLGSVALFLLCLLAWWYLPTGFADAANVVALMSPLVLVGAAYLAAAQVLMAAGRFSPLAVVSNGMLMAGVLLTLLATPMFGLAALVLAELVATMLGVAALVVLTVATRAASRYESEGGDDT